VVRVAYLICEVCGKAGFKSKAGLVGHRKIAHGVDTRKTVPDELGKRLDKIGKTLESLVCEHVIRDFVRVAKREKRSVEEAYVVMERPGHKMLKELVRLYGEGYMRYSEGLEKEVEKLPKVEI